MAKELEHKIRFEAAAIYLIVALGVVAMVIYLSSLRKEITSQRVEITNQQALLSATNRLIFAMSEAQSSSSLYLSTKRPSHLRHYLSSIDRIGMLIDTILLQRPDHEAKLLKIEALLRMQIAKITTLNDQFSRTNPVSVIRERLQQYEPQDSHDTLIVSIRQDTVVSKVPRRGFFRRLGDVFRPNKDSVRIIVNQRTDTIRTTSNDSLGILSEVGQIAQQAQQHYDQNLKTIEQQVAEVIFSDKELAGEAFSLLSELHQQTLDATLSAIHASEAAIERNYLYSLVGGLVALVLILVFIGLIITDINKGREARQALEYANEQVRRIMESRHRLLLSVAHDIKSPLNSMLGYLGMMPGDERVCSMQNSSEHILAMLENLLEFSSLEQGGVQVNSSDFNLRELCREICTMFQPLAQQKSLALHCDAEQVRITTDRVKLKQIAINLLSNAVKYTTDGSIGLRAWLDEERLHLEIRDTGAGIPANKLPQLFRPFSRVEENNRLAEGSGLGLFVVKGLTDLLGGELVVDSIPGAGTRIRVSLLVARAVRAIPQGTKRVRIYDDDPVMVSMASDLLRRLGHRVVVENPDLVLTDMEMGVLSGLDVLHSAGDVPVVVMTGRADFSAGRARDLGFCAFLAKPFSEEALREVVGQGEAADDLLGDDREAILALFRTSTAENFLHLRRAITRRNFDEANALCHKMYPMFAQLGYPTEALRRMDTHRHKEYVGWCDDVEAILALQDEILAKKS